MAIFLQLFTLFSPIVRDLIAKHQATSNGMMPTEAELTAAFNANIDLYLSEGAAWKAAHAGQVASPAPPTGNPAQAVIIALLETLHAHAAPIAALLTQP